MEEYKPKIPTITVKYKNVRVETDALVGSAGIPTVGNTFVHMLQVRGATGGLAPVRNSECCAWTDA